MAILILEQLAQLTLVRSALNIWLLDVEITDEFVLGLDVLLACVVPVDLGRHLLRPGREDVTPWSSGARPHVSRLILAICRGYPAGRERPRGPQLEDFPARRTVFRQAVVLGRQNVPVRIVNVSDRVQMLAGGATLGRSETITWAASFDKLEFQLQRTCCL